MKCRFKYCKKYHESQEVDKEDAVKEGNMYFHKDCYQIRKDVQDIATLFYEKVNPNVVYPQLIKTINNIVYDKGIESAYLLFALKYYVEHKIPLNYPGGLYYVIQNREVDKAWKTRKAAEVKKQPVKIYVDDDMNLTPTFTHTVKKQRSIGDIFNE